LGLDNLNHNDPIIQDGDSEFTLRGFMMEEVNKGIEDWLLKYEEMQFLNKIGGGSTCEVYRGEYRGLDCAIKRISLEVCEKSRPFIKEFKRELSTLLKLRPHPNLVSLVGVCQHKDNLYLVMEYCKGGTLFDFLHKKKQPLSWEQKRKMVLDIAKGMVFLHECSDPVIHRDLKS
jgi:serine/threonine protein kinase